VILNADALEAAAKAVGSTEIATLAITTYLDTLADEVEGKVEIRELGSIQDQLPGVDWQRYEEGS
jgi:hypothetical protein